MSLKSAALAFQFLTIIPVKVKGEVSEKNISDSTEFFPFVGLFQGLLLSIAALLLIRLFSTEVTSGLVLLVYVLTNGGFHLDGLSDSFDALSIKSTGDKERDREKRLAVMKDSTTGAIGAVAIWFTLFLKYLLIRECFLTSSLLYGCFILFMMPILSKWALVSAMFCGRSARKDGLGRIFLEGVRYKHLVVSTVLTLAIFLAPFFILRIFQKSNEWQLVLFCISVMVMIYFFTLLLSRLFVARFKGMTGDNFGAIHEMTEILFLTVVILWG